MKKLLAIMLVLWAGGAAGYWYYTEGSTRVVGFHTVKLERGDLRATINATGTIEPEEVVDVGAQIAGEVQSFGPDPRDPSKPISYGSPVEQGTVLARLDDGLFKARVAQGEAGVAKAEADVESAQVKVDQSDRELARKEELAHKGQRALISAQEMDDVRSNYQAAKAALIVARASVQVAKTQLDEAKVNLRYATITSPVKGEILDRRVNIGQTVVASLNAPSLFLIAKDLTKMEIWASVNETDIGQIHVGQKVRFSVSARPSDEFTGQVTQIRDNASMNSGVVTYTVVVGFENTGGKLRPYLTARLRFEVDDRRGVLLVPNAALRWQPKPEYVAPGFDARAAGRATTTTTTTTTTTADAPGVPGVLWVRQGEATVKPMAVRVGTTDGARTEILSGLEEGAEVVEDLDLAQKPTESESPFLPKLDKPKRKAK